MRVARTWSARFDGSLLVILAFVLCELALPYRGAVVEADSARVGYGIINGATSGRYFTSRDLYGSTFSFGYYALFWLIYPRLFNDFHVLPAVMNGFNLISVALALWVFHRWVKALFGGAIAFASVLLMAATPVLFELGGYGHPEGPAFLGLNLAILALVKTQAARNRLPLLLAAAVAAFAAATLRADVFLAFPALPFLAVAAAPRERRIRAFLEAVLVAGVAAAGFFAAQAQMLALAPPRIFPAAGGVFTGKVSMKAMVIEYWHIGTSIHALAKGIAVWLTGLGPVLLVLGFLGCLWLLLKRQSFGLAALTLILPGATFWLTNPTPSRHLLLTFLGLVPAAVLWLRAVTGRRFGLAVALTLALNLVAMDAIVPTVLKNYNFFFVNLLPRRVNLWVPLGNPVTARRWAQKQMALELDQVRQLADTTEPKVFVCGAWVSVRLVHELYQRGNYQVEYLWRHGGFLYHVTTPKTEYLIYDYGGPPVVPSKVMLERVAAAGDYRDFAIAIAPSDQPVVDPAVVPPGYRELPLVLPAWLTRE